MRLFDHDLDGKIDQNQLSHALEALKAYVCPLGFTIVACTIRKEANQTYNCLQG